MSPIAVDVVLLPDEAMTDRVVEINKQLSPELTLSREDRRPHISLAIGCMEEKNREAIRPRLEDLARKTTVRQLRVVGLVSAVNSRGEPSSLLAVEKTPLLQALHEEVMQEMQPFFRYEPTKEMVDGEVVTPSTLDWIRTYPEKASYEHFRPHITLGYGPVPLALSFPIPFVVTHLALCHLGNHCTCRRVLVAARLPTRNDGIME